jgi:pimeloyl-ACP methyl ester carboxylesterase
MSCLSIGNKLVCLCVTIILWFFGASWSATATEYSHEIVACNFDNKDWYNEKYVQCSQLIINEAGQSESFVLPVVQLKNKQGVDDLAPVIFLQGGPGGLGVGPSEAVENWYDREIREYHDILLIDFRGTGNAKPEFCPNISIETLFTLSRNLTPQEEITQRVEQAQSCFERMPFTGDVPALFTSRKSAQDIDALRGFMGYEKLNLYGVSYGTKVAMAYAEAFPDTLAGMVLDSVVPPDYAFYQDIPKNFETSLERLFSDCENSSSCNEKYPSFRKDFYATLASLNKYPLKIELLNKDIEEKGELVVNPQDFLIIFRQLMYGRDFLPILPLLIDEMKKGNVEPLALLFDLVLANQARAVNFATYYMVLGKEELSVKGGERFHQQTEQSSIMPGVTLFKSDFILYEQAREFFGEPEIKIKVNVMAPTLIMSGSYDPMTPPAYAENLAKRIPSSTYFEFGDIGHSPSFTGGCPRKIVNEFFKTGTSQPSYDCVKEQLPVNFVTGLLLNNGLLDLVKNIRYKKNKLPIFFLLAMAAIYLLSIFWCLWRLIITLILNKKARSRFDNDRKANLLFFSGLALAFSVLGVLGWIFVQGVQSYGFASLLFGLSPYAWTMVPALFLLMAVTILMMHYARKAWINKSWKLSGRIYFTGVLLANAGLLSFLARWGLF